MSTSQRIMLFGLWKRATAVLMPGRETWTKHEEDQRRREVTRDALGEEKSWSDLSNADVDKLKGALLAIIEPGDLKAQLRQLNQERSRLLHGIRRLKRELDVTDAYLQGIVDRMDARRGTTDRDDADAWERERERDERPQRTIADLGPDELRKVLIALREHKRRGGGTVAEPKRKELSVLDPVGCLHAQTASVGVHTQEEPF